MTTTFSLDKSPFRRLREATGLNKAQFLAHAHIAESTLNFVEAGLYPMNPERAVQSLLAQCALKEVPINEILAEYGGGTIDGATVVWQTAVRQALADKVVESYERVRMAPRDELSPLTDFASATFGTRDAFCKAMKVPVAVVYQFDVGVVKAMPKLLRAALTDAGMTERRINELEEEQQRWVRDGAESLALVD